MTVTNSLVPKTTVKIKVGSSFVKIRPFFSFDSRYIIIAAGNDIKVFSTASGECVRQLFGHSCPVVGLQTNPANHTQLISCSQDGTIITWDYNDGINLKKFKIKGSDEVFAFYVPSKSGRTFVIQFSKKQNGYLLRSVKLKRKVIYPQFVMKNIVPSEHSVAFGVQGDLVASVSENALQVFDLQKGIIKRHLTQSKLVCVTCHPTECIVATGDETGRILVWGNIFDHQNLCHSVYHWHTLPVEDLCFSAEGNYLYSGGGECVLVKWNLQRESREFVPRLGMPICHLVTAPDNAFIAVSHMDNAVSLVSPEQKIVQYFQGLSQGHPWSCPGQKLAPTGLIYDPRTGALVMSGRPGHLQFYSLKHDKQLYSVDIVGQNFLTQERNRQIFNTQVEKAAIDDSSSWMTTVQRYDDGKTSPDIVLKVWKYDSILQTYTLNTTVILPHYQEVNCLRFRPEVVQETPLFVTTSKDLSFKTWVLQATVEGATTMESWSCESRGHYHDQCPADANFKQDGSLLAIAFQTTITLWNPSPLVLNATLSHSSSQLCISQVFFGREGCSHMLICRSDDCLTVWDTELRKPTWKAQLMTTHLTGDPLSEYLAAFSQDHTLYVFKPSSAEPCFIKTKVSNSDVIAAAFMPHTRPQTNQDRSLVWQEKSLLYFLNTDQELLTVVNDCDESEECNPQEDNEEEASSDHFVKSGTNFAVLIAQRKSSGVKTPESFEHHTTRGLLGAREVKELLEIPSHVMPPLLSLCVEFMSALLIPKSNDVS